jgi:SpoIIAA-like
MIELLPDMPEGVTGIRVSGRVSGDDMHELQPLIDELLKGEEIRIVEIVAHGYDGWGPDGMSEDLKIGFAAIVQHPSSFKRIAMVSDEEWITETMDAMAWTIPGEIKLFRLDDLERAKDWAAGNGA